jgi:hypothetical protein
MTRIKIPPPVSGGLMLSYKCSAECRHCMYACSPRWAGDWISEEDLARGLPQLARWIEPSPWGARAVSLSHGLHFSGGEPFLNFELLLRAVEMAEELHIPSTFVETNCVWCRSDDVAKDRLQRLKAAGLKGIMISVNPFYAEYVPFERTERCIRLSLDVLGANVMVYQQEYYRLFRQLGIKDRISLEDYVALTGGENLAGRVEMFLMGRAARELRDLYAAYPFHRFLDQPCLPPFLRDWHNHFDNYGNFMPGFCGGITLGNWLELDRLVEEGIELSEQPVLGFLIAGDMRGLYHFAQDLGYQASEEGYLSKCDFCLDVRKYLATVGEFAELQPREFYAAFE